MTRIFLLGLLCAVGCMGSGDAPGDGPEGPPQSPEGDDDHEIDESDPPVIGGEPGNPCPAGWLDSTDPLPEACLDSLMVTVELYPEFRAAGEDPMDYYAENEADDSWPTPEYPADAPLVLHEDEIAEDDDDAFTWDEGAAGAEGFEDEGSAGGAGDFAGSAERAAQFARTMRFADLVRAAAPARGGFVELDGEGGGGMGGLPPEAFDHEYYDAGYVPPATDAGYVPPTTDAGYVPPTTDAGVVDAGPADTGVVPVDAALADAGITVDAGALDASITLDSGVVTVDAGVISVDATVVNPMVDGGVQVCSDGTYTASGDVSFDVPFNGHYGPIFITDFGGPFGRRHHYVYGQADFSGAAHLRLGGSISGSARGWSATISGSGTGNVTAQVLVWQQFRRGNNWSTHTVATATITGAFTFADSATIRQDCPSTSGPVITSGPPTMRMTVNVPAFQFYGLLFPNLNGGIVTAVRSAITRFVHNRMTGMIQSSVDSQLLQTSQRYQTAKSQLLANLQARLQAKLPPGCGCGLLQAADGVISTLPMR